MKHKAQTFAAVSKKLNGDIQFLVVAFFFLTSLAFFYGARGSIYYSLKGISVYWFHHSYHYLAIGWTWLLLLPMMLLIKRRFRSNRTFLLASALIAFPISILHRFSALFLDFSFRWIMGYIPLNPIQNWSEILTMAYPRIFDSFITFVVIIASLVVFQRSRSTSFKPTKPSIPAKHGHPNLQRLVAKKNGKLFLLSIDTVSAFQSEGNYLRVFYEGEWVLIRETAKSMVEKLDPSSFLRINRSTILHVDFIQNLEPYFNGEYLITMKDGSTHKTSKTYRQGLDRLLKN